MDGQLLYTFLSLAITQDTPQGKLVPVEGMKIIAALAHGCDVPVTWIVDSQSVEESKDILIQGHRECGDDVVLLIDIPSVLNESGTAIPASKAEEIFILRQKLPGYILSERRKIKEMLPWAEADVIAADVKTEVLVEVLEELGCIGLWGYNWAGGLGHEDKGKGRRGKRATRQVPMASTSSIPSFPQPPFSPSLPDGCPWSFFYASKDRHDAPVQRAGGVVAVESTSLDLNAVFHSGNSRVFSPEPNALRMAGLCADEDMPYLKALLHEYLKNCSWNRFVIFLQQQPAYEMEYASYNAYDKGTISEMAGILNGFFHEVTSNPGIKALTLPQAIRLYKREFEYTEGCYMAFDSIISPHTNVDFYVPPEPKQKPPYPFTFFYYDRELQRP